MLAGHGLQFFRIRLRQVHHPLVVSKIHRHQLRLAVQPKAANTSRSKCRTRKSVR